jgi:hypothetical protein
MTGEATLWIKSEAGDVIPQPVGLYESAAEHEQQVVILHVNTGDATLNVVFRRGELSKLLANPNDLTAATEVAVNIEMEAENG